MPSRARLLETIPSTVLGPRSRPVLTRPWDFGAPILALGGLLLTACGSREVDVATHTSNRHGDASAEPRSDAGCGTSSNGGPLDDAGGCSPAVVDRSTLATEVPEALLGSLVYVSQYGTGVVSLTPHHGSSLGTPIPLGPSRGRDWGVARANLSFLAVSPDESWAVVCLAGTHGEWLYALALDGSTREAPLKLAEVCPRDFQTFTPGNRLAFDEQGTHLAFIGEDGLWVLPLDGTALPQLVLVAAVATEVRLGSLWWADDRIVYLQESGASERLLYSVAADGSEVDSPTLLGPFTSYIWTVLHGQAAVLDVEGNRISTIDGKLTRLVPHGPPWARLMATSEPQQRAVYMLWSNEAPSSSLISVALDGSEADAPLPLLGEHADIDQVAVLPNGDGLIVQVRNEYGTRQLYEVGWDDRLPARLISERSDAELHAVSTDGQWLYGCSGEAVVRMRRDADGAAWDATPADIAELALDVPGMTAPGPRYVTCGAQVLPNTGATDTSSTVARGTVLLQERFGRSAVFLRTPTGAHLRLTGEHKTPIEQAVVPPGAAHVYYRNADGWHAAALDGSNAGDEQMVLAANLPGSVARLMAMVGSVPVFLQGKQLYSVPDGKTPHPLGDPTDGYRMALTDDSIISAIGGQLFDIPLAGGDPTLVIEETGYYRDGDVFYDSVRDQVIARVGERLLAVARDGSERTSPRVLLEAVHPGYYFISTLYGDSVVIALAEHAAIEHPYGAALVALDGSDAAGAREVRRAGLFLPIGDSQQSPVWGPFLSPDDAWVLHRGASWELLPSDERSQLDALPIDGPPSTLNPLSRPPKGDWLLAHGTGEPLWRLPLSPDERADLGAVPLTPPLDGLATRHWLNAGQQFAFETEIEGTTRILLTNTDGSGVSEFTVLAGSSANPAELQGVTLDGDGIIYSTPAAPASKIFSLTPSAQPVALTDDTDSEERFAGWVQVTLPDPRTRRSPQR